MSQARGLGLAFWSNVIEPIVLVEKNYEAVLLPRRRRAATKPPKPRAKPVIVIGSGTASAVTVKSWKSLSLLLPRSSKEMAVPPLNRVPPEVKFAGFPAKAGLSDALMIVGSSPLGLKNKAS